MTAPPTIRPYAVRSLSMRRTLACWSRALSRPVRAGQMSMLSAWAHGPLAPPRLRRGPLFGHRLSEVVAVEHRRRTDDAGPTPTPHTRARHAGVRAEPAPATDRSAGRPPDTSRPRRPQTSPALPAARAERHLLRRLAGETEISVPTRGRPPVPSAVPNRPRPAPCLPGAALALATDRAVGRLRAAASTARSHATPTPGSHPTPTPPAQRPVSGPAATPELLRQQIKPHRDTSPAGPELPVRGFASTDPRASGSPRPALPQPPDGPETEPRPADLARALWPRTGEAPSGPREGALVPVAAPTASERLGPAPVVTTSHPALVEPAPVGAPTIPVAVATLRRGAARDAEVPDFLDSAELTNRIAQVLRDEARRHGIEV